MNIENKYDLRQTVYLLTDIDQRARLVCEIIVTPGAIMYQLACGEDVSRHYHFEISATKDYARQ